VCFSALLEQNYNFDWMERCFISRLNPQKALKKLRKYLACAHSATPPVVVQMKEEIGVVWKEGFARVKSPCEALCAWMRVVKTDTGGLFTRKANVSSVWNRLRHARQGEESKKEENVPSERILLPDL
jgi:hypothetical protein